MIDFSITESPCRIGNTANNANGSDVGFYVAQLHYHAIIIRLQRSRRINLIHLDFLECFAGEIKQRSAHDGVVLCLELMTIFEDENCRGLLSSTGAGA